MKKMMIFFAMLMEVVTANAQLKVDANGNVGVNTNPSSTYTLNIKSGEEQRVLNVYNSRPSNVNYAIYSYTSQTADSAASYSIRADAYAKGSRGHSYGLYSFASSKNNGYSIAVYGKGDNVATTNPGRCYGVVGTIGASCSGYGVGILGSTNGGWI